MVQVDFDQMKITVLGLHCKEDNIGLFFRLNSKVKAELWPHIRNYVDSSILRICTENVKQYEGIDQMFDPSIVHLRTNNSINTIIYLGKQNRLLEISIKCRRSSHLLHQYMALFFYRNMYLNKYRDYAILA